MKMILEYPVFVFGKKDVMANVYFDEKQLKKTNIEIFHPKNFKNFLMVDASGMKYTIESAYITGYDSRKTDSSILSFEYISNDVGFPISLEELKDMIIKRIPRSAYFFSTASETEQLKEKVIESATIQQLAQVIADSPLNVQNNIKL